MHRDYETFVRGDNDAPTVTSLRATPDNMLGLFHTGWLRFQLMALMGADAWQQYHRQVVASHAQLAQVLGGEWGGNDARGARGGRGA